jgi:RNA polymerase primary sigma factor
MDILEEERSILHIYIDQLKKFRVLSREEELVRARKAKQGDRSSTETLILSNLRFVVSLAVKYQHLGLPLTDLINEGNIGLMKAIDKFDPERGLRFISFARWWIRHYILKAVFEQTSSIRIPLRYASRITDGIGSNGKPREKLLDFYRPLSLDQLLSDDENSESVMAFVGSEQYGLPEDKLMRDSMTEVIQDAMRKLKPIEKEILCCRYGLDGAEPLTLREIGKRYNLTKERIRQIMHKALEKLKYPMEKREILAYVS